VLLIVLGIAVTHKHQDVYGGERFIDVYAPVLMVFVLAILALNALPATLVAYRDRGYLRRLSTTPVGAPRLLVAQLLINLGVATCAVVLIAVVARLAFAVSLPSELGGFVIALLLGAAAMLALGTLIAAIAPNQRIAGLVGSLLFFGMMFFAGLWVPRAQMGPALRHVSDFTPLGAAVGAAQDAVGGHFPHAAHLAVLAAYALIFCVAAGRLFRWDR
jgi:ABC-2 type transport system permease protein